MFLEELHPSLDDQTGLEKSTAIEFVERIRLQNTSCKKFVYKITGTDNAVILHIEISKKGEIKEIAKLHKNYFSDRHYYGEESRKIAKKYQLPAEVVLAITPEYAKDFSDLVKKLTIVTGLECELIPYRLNSIAIKELSSKNKSRKRKAILAILPGMPSGLREHIKEMGPKNIDRMAKFLIRLATPDS